MTHPTPQGQPAVPVDIQDGDPILSARGDGAGETATVAAVGEDQKADDDTQYGASPLRPARYDENHQANKEIAEGKSRSGRHGTQARYPAPQEISGTGPTGHDEQQQSIDLNRNGR